MKREDILKMEPGRELDALVAEKVFQIERVNFIPYSVELSAAWEVVDRMFEIRKPLAFSVGNDGEVGKPWRATMCHPFAGSPADDGSMLYETAVGLKAPEAICKAALLALIEEEST